MTSEGGYPPPEGWPKQQRGYGLAYRFLSRSFYQPPTLSWMLALVDERLFESWPVPVTSETTPGLTLLREYCEGWEPSGLQELEWDFNRLFVGPGKMLAPPWESVHRSSDGLTFQRCTLEVRGVYEEFGLQAPELHREPDDHLALELAFVAHLSELAVSAAEQGDQALVDRCFGAQRRFLEDHAMAWMPACLALVNEHAETDYFLGLAGLTLGTLEGSSGP